MFIFAITGLYDPTKDSPKFMGSMTPDRCSGILTQLPEGKTQGELIEMARAEILQDGKVLMGQHVFLNGRITTGMALMLGHELCHICKSVWIFDPKEKAYIRAIWH